MDWKRKTIIFRWPQHQNNKGEFVASQNINTKISQLYILAQINSIRLFKIKR